MGSFLAIVGRSLARFLSREIHVHGVAPSSSAEQLLAALRPADVLLVEGHSRISSAIKYLSQSTWSHAALYVGRLPSGDGASSHCFVEADILHGVRAVGIDEFTGFHTRICRPFWLSDTDCGLVTKFAIDRIGQSYDLRNIIDLARYLLPNPPVPVRFRRRMLSLGSGDPTKAICSTLIAQAFQSVRYPVLPIASRRSVDSPDCPGCVEEIFHVRHHSLFAPRDFDVSPYFQVVKPPISADFDYKALNWSVDSR